jgi:hypothetical protein
VDYLKKQIDMATDFDSTSETKVESKIPKRRPKYLDKKIIDNSLDLG